MLSFVEQASVAFASVVEFHSVQSVAFAALEFTFGSQSVTRPDIAAWIEVRETGRGAVCITT